MPLKPVYLIDGRRWIPLGRAATLLATNTATVKRLMADGSLEWTQRAAGSTTLLVEEAGLLRLRTARGAAGKEREARATAATRTADRRGASMRRTIAPPGSGGSGTNFGILVPTWDPSPSVAPISGRGLREVDE